MALKLILEIPPGVKDVATLTAILNDRIRDLGENLKVVVPNPATANVNLGGKQINNVGDPSNDFDAVNLRTLRQNSAIPAVTQTTAQERTIIVDDDSVTLNGAAVIY